MKGQLTIMIQTLTPLWTGGVELSEMYRVHETGLVGSLRWWYEAIIRGLGGDACDPTSEGADANQCPRSNGSYCDVCQLFGATGKRRRFRLRLQDGEPLFTGSSIPLPSGRIHTQPSLRIGRWYLQSQARMGDALQLQITPLDAVNETVLLLTPVTLIHRHASLGAKVSNGYGVVFLTQQGKPITVDKVLLDQLPSGSRSSVTLPDIRHFFFAKLSFQAPSDNPTWWRDIQGITEAWTGKVMDRGNILGVYDQNPNSKRNNQRCTEAQGNLQAVVTNGILPLAPAVRNWLRYRWNSGLNDCQKYYLFGEARPVCPHCCHPGYREDKKNRAKNWCPNCNTTFPKGQEHPHAASKINVSHAYRLSDGRWEFRIWGWIPCISPPGFYFIRDKFLTQLRTALNTAQEWKHVFGSSSFVVPTVTEWHMLNCNNQDGRKYLEELLGIAEGGTS